MSPFVSRSQARALHAKAARGEISEAKVHEFDEITKRQKGGFKKLPERVKEKQAKAKNRKR